MADINIYDSITTSEWNGRWIDGGYGLATLPYRSIDIMGMTKDTLDNNVSSTITDNLIESLNNKFNLTHIGTSIPINTNAEALADRGYNFDSEPATYAAQYHDKIHSEGLGVLWRGVDCTFEYGGLYNMTPIYDRRNGNRFTYLAQPITDDFSSTSYRSHGYEMISVPGQNIGGVIYGLENYTYPYQWSITNGELVGPAGSGWSRYIYFNANYIKDVTMVAKVKKIGNQQIVVRASTDLNYPGYGLQMRDTNELRIERPGLEALATTSFTWVENSWYWLKLEAVGTTIRGKAWAVGTSEPVAWDLSVTNSAYSSGYCGFSGEGSYGHFDDMNITPIKDTDTWLARICDYVNTNIDLFADGDILAPFLEADFHQQLEVDGLYNPFFVDVKYCLDAVCAANNLVCHTGFSSQNFTSVIQGGRSGEMFSIPQITPIDHYGACLGLNERFPTGDTARQTNVSGTDTYTVPTSLSESATDRCSFIPEKLALNQDIDIYIVNRGTGDWTMTIHNEYNQPVQLPDHTDYSSKTNNYQLTKTNNTLTDNAWNTFQIYWDNPDCDRTYHFHLTSTVANGTVRVLSGYSGNMEAMAFEQFKTNASPEAMEIDIRKIYEKHGQPVFLEEWGDFWSLDPTRSTPIRTTTEHIEYLKSMYDAFARLADDGILKGFNYWRATGGNEEIMTNLGTDLIPDYQPEYDGTVLETYFNADLWHEDIEVSESVDVVRLGTGVSLINVSDTNTVQDIVTTTPPNTLVISGVDILDQSQPLASTFAGFGEFNSVRYRGMGFQTSRGIITAVSFQLQSVGTQDLKVYIDTADASSVPEHSIKGELYSWTIPNAQLSTGLTKYTLPVPLTVTPTTQYCIYFASWSITNNQYTDDYRDLGWQNADVYSTGGPIVNTAGTWAVSDNGNLDLRFEIYAQGDLAELTNVSESVTAEVSGTATPDPLSISVVAKGVVIVG